MCSDSYPRQASLEASDSAPKSFPVPGFQPAPLDLGSRESLKAGDSDSTSPCGDLVSKTQAPHLGIENNNIYFGILSNEMGYVIHISIHIIMCKYINISILPLYW